MRKYLSPWRRVVDYIVLMVTCICACGWMRGLIGIEDTITIGVGERYFVLCLNNHWPSETPGIWIYHCVYHETFNPVQLKRRLFTWEEAPQSLNDVMTIRTLKEQFRRSYEWDAAHHWERESSGFGLAGNVYSTGCGAPYWSIVLPLTIISAYLLLSKPKRKASGDSAAAT